MELRFQSDWSLPVVAEADDVCLVRQFCKVNRLVKLILPYKITSQVSLLNAIIRSPQLHKLSESDHQLKRPSTEVLLVPIRMLGYVLLIEPFAVITWLTHANTDRDRLSLVHKSHYSELETMTINLDRLDVSPLTAGGSINKTQPHSERIVPKTVPPLLL